MSPAIALEGTFTALLTPFSKDGAEVDFASLDRLVNFQLDHGVSGLVPCGSTGEAATLLDDEYEKVIARVVALCKNRSAHRALPVVAGVNSSSTRRAIELGIIAKRAGADALLMVPPPYNKPPQRGIVAHFKAVKSAIGLPIVAYNIPGRTAVTISNDSLMTLFNDGAIIGVKDSTANVGLSTELLSKVDSSFSLVSSEDEIVLPLMSVGGKGVISATSNIVPDRFVAITSSFQKGDYARAREAQAAVLPYVRTAFLDTNPIPLKAAAALLGLISFPTVRLPLMEALPPVIEAWKGLLDL